MKKVLIIGGSAGGAMVLLAGLSVVALVAAAVMMGNSRGERISFQNGELYYKDSIETSEAEALANYLEEQFGSLKNQKTFQVERDGEDIMVRMCTQSKAWETDKLDYSYQALEMMLQMKVFTDENVVVQLCDQNLKPQKTIDSFPAGKTMAQAQTKPQTK